MSTFNFNKIIDQTNDSIKAILEPLARDIQTNFDIVDKLNVFIEELPKYKILLNDYQSLLTKYNSLSIDNENMKEQISNHEKHIKLLLLKNIELNHFNMKEKNHENNNSAYWYDNNNYETKNISNNNVKLLIDEYESFETKKNIQTLYSTYGIYLMNELKKKDKENKIIRLESNSSNESDINSSGSNNEDEISEDEDEDDEADEDEADEADDEEENKENNDDNEDDENIDVFEMIINKKRYYVSNEKNGNIYNIIDNDEVGEKIGFLKKGKPIFI